MEKRKRWHFFLIITAVILTIYNILPTVFYYAHPLKKPVDKERALPIAQAIENRVNALEDEATSWVKSFCNLLQIKPLSISLDKENVQIIQAQFKNIEDAERFRKFLPQAGNSIEFLPAQLSLYDPELTSKTVLIQRRIPLHFDTAKIENDFQFGTKRDSQGNLTDLYKGLVQDRFIQLGTILGGVSENGLYAEASLKNLDQPQSQDLLMVVAQNLTNFVKIFDENSPIAKRYFATLTQIDESNKTAFVDNVIKGLETLKSNLLVEKTALSQEKDSIQKNGGVLDTLKEQRLDLLKSQEKIIIQALSLVRHHKADFAQGQTPWNYTSSALAIQASSHEGAVQKISLANHNPFIDEILIDWSNDRFLLKLYPDFEKARLQADNEVIKDQIDQLLYNEIARLSSQSGESIKPFQEHFEIALSQLQDSQSFLALRLFAIATAEVAQLKNSLLLNWQPQHPDLKQDVFPIWDYETYQSLPDSQKKLGLVIFAPSLYNKMPPKGLKMNSIYIIAKGLDRISQRVETNPESESSQQFFRDIRKLHSLMQNNGLFGYSGQSHAIAGEFVHDTIFEGENYYQTVLKATREDFRVYGTKRYAILEFTDVEQRILTDNKIGNQIHEDLLKWRDNYAAAKLGLRGLPKYTIPAPTKNALWDNFLLSFVKYFRGDERKILHWGLDMSGGKTVQIELRDKSNHIVSHDTDMKQAINELYNRVNKMGVSEVSIRQEGNTIALDFPGSQSLSAAELIKASSMYFHIVNEKFMSNPSLQEATNRFLQEIWNEAVVTNRKDIEDINQIAWRHLYGNSVDPETVQPRSTAAKTLYDHGLRLPSPQDTGASSLFDTTYSMITQLRGDDFKSWQGKTNPLLIVFRNYALEGSSLEDVRASYTPSEGNFLQFRVKGSQALKDGTKFNPRDDVEAWSSQFAKDKIAGTPLESFARGEGWRMAVILNGSVITSPTLKVAIRDSASITGSFTQREINQLEADLKAGSLSFTPRILSEKNVSPELGAQERLSGIVAMFCALILVITTMIAYYRFGGLVASIAVLFNLLIMWAALQNIGATLSLAGIAGIILTVAMAVDANVLVFERIREEFAVTGRIASAVHAGYRKAFSAIIDSNVTTIIAALILLHFDAGPIRGFALTLIIGIVSSLFSALFMTRFFFAGWVQNPKNKELKMSHLIKSSSFDFLKYTKPTILISAILILVGGYFLFSEKQNILGMDFTGGYALTVEVPPTSTGLYRQGIEQALIAQGASSQDFQIRELNPANNLRIFLSHSLEQAGRPFYEMPLQTDLKELPYAYQNNPRIIWVVDALKNAGIQLSPNVLTDLGKNWSAISGQMSDSMRTNALLGIAAALACILIYITIRFEFKYAISATLCLIHDLVFCIAMIALLYKLGVPIQIDLHTVAALMTIVGYSLNDTIIIFDRIREDMVHMRHSKLNMIINHALNITLSRTLMTSGITLLVLIPLIALGGSTIFGFALVMAIGVVFGTLSSLFVAAPLMQYFHRREIQKHEKLVHS